MSPDDVGELFHISIAAARAISHDDMSGAIGLVGDFSAPELFGVITSLSWLLQGTIQKLAEEYKMSESELWNSLIAIIEKTADETKEK